MRYAFSTNQRQLLSHKLNFGIQNILKINLLNIWLTMLENTKI